MISKTMQRYPATTFICITSILLAGLSGCTPPDSAEPVVEDSISQPIEATAGVGIAGKKTSQDKGITKAITGPVSALEHVKQMAVFDLQIKPAVQAFRALEGRYPSHDEFMENIVKKNRLKLPELAEGSVYYFDDQQGQLMVYPQDQFPGQ